MQFLINTPPFPPSPHTHPYKKKKKKKNTGIKQKYRNNWQDQG